jgi:hypothetical protein
MRYIYILLLGLIIYYIISRFYENYTENFDPSLVPVSSIVTLAKVAQKLVDGNGTLTNPGNLTLGTPSAVGNLLVTGNTTTSGNESVGGNTTVGGTLGVTGASTLTGNTTVGGTLGVTGASTLTGNTTVGGTLGVTGNTNIGGAFGVTGASTLTGNTKVGGTLGVTGAATVSSTLGVTGNLTGSNINATGQLSGNNLQIAGININAGAYPDSGRISWGDGSGWRLGFPGKTSIYDNGTVIAGANFCIGGTCINESHLKMLTGAQSIALHYNKANSISTAAAGGKSYVGASSYVADGVNIIATDDGNRRSSFFIAPN